MQHLWAELSEKSSDVLDPMIKYGGGTDSWRSILTSSSEAVASCEDLEEKGSKAVAAYKEMVAAHEKFKKATAELLEHHLPDHEVQEMQRKLKYSTREMERAEQRSQEIQDEMVRFRDANAGFLTKAISLLDKLKGQKQ